MRVLHFSDLHIGVENYGRTDPVTGLSTRLLDFLSTFDELVDYALDNNVDVRTTVIGDVMSHNPQTIRPGMLAEQALNLMEDRSINGVVVVDKDNHPIGALNMLDLVRAGVM